MAHSPVMKTLFDELEILSKTDLSVLLTGETGTGKEEAARGLHAHSRRAREPFVVCDCTSLPMTLAESLLFGHERGVFTGADKRHTGLFESANKGTIFIDEVGELPIGIQAKLLRVLDRQEFTRLGSSALTHVDVRIISATHRDLAKEVKEGRFRQDLFYRLAETTVRIPPLRERVQDIPILVKKLLSSFQNNFEVSAAAYSSLAKHPWPGNVRELRNVVKRAAHCATTASIDVADVRIDPYENSDGKPLPVNWEEPFISAKKKVIDRFEAKYLSALISRCKNLAHAARQAGIERHHLRILLKKHGLYRRKET